MGINSRGLGDEEGDAAFDGAADQPVPFSWGKAWSDPRSVAGVGPVTCSLDVHDSGQLYAAAINVFLKPD